jgi:hypothetical protein
MVHIHRISTRTLFVVSLIVLTCLIILTPSPARSASTSASGSRGAAHVTRVVPPTTGGSNRARLLLGWHGR